MLSWNVFRCMRVAVVTGVMSVGAVVVMVFGAAAVSAAPLSWVAVGAGSVAVERAPVFIDAPCSVAGYTNHAIQRMTERGITRRQVEDVVSLTCPAAVWQPESQTWFYDGTWIGVAVNNNGWVVTVFRRDCNC